MIKINKYLFLVLYFAFIIFGCLIAKYIEITPLSELLFLTSFSYQSIFIALAAICFFIFVMKLKIKENKLIIFLGDKTLIIYYVHLLFLNLIMANVMNKYVTLSFIFSDLIKYGFWLSIIIYILSLIVAIIFKLLVKLFKRLKI